MPSALPPTLAIALKEWAAVCNALATGRQIILLRKGGIYESAGEFELEHPSFLFFPTYLHQNLKMLKSEAHAGFEPRTAEPEKIPLSLAGHVTDILQLKSRAQMDRLDTQHIWTAPLIDMRFNYRPENPLYLLLVRAYTLPQVITVENTPAYAGCKSWVPLEQEISTSAATAVLSEEEFTQRQNLVKTLLSE
jgi:hypothetical protein